MTGSRPSQDLNHQTVRSSPMDRAATRRWLAGFAGLLAALIALVWGLTTAMEADGTRGQGEWTILSVLVTAILVASVLTRLRRARTNPRDEVTWRAKDTGSVSGRVLRSGFPVTDGRVKALRVARETTGDPNGNFTLERLEVGRHVLEITGGGRRVLRRVDVQAEQLTYVRVDLATWTEVMPRRKDF